ncbi:30S ribosomal protein S12 methylthiotransferase RimO [Aquihabitans sp. G128]|uniref:30S ribosomal protein S12 methylthiotransferase RimO n=1 Tax=Aquihabitans sp. G128 TaxID=2849779 RepID=UPI001C226AD3|nr:30S ribosomal protein S12 methylthiotransferase RimO [Aquihabitans sp. G128]QXC62516.1 30S ribosomal protein S12 methylthiotransferase RimO [Aquihabitans sp. G128]
MSSYHLVTLGCPKNEVDSEKLVGQLGADGFAATDDPGSADLLVVNTCAFIGEARQESIDTILGLADQKAAGARLVVTGCMAERYGDELTDAMPEIDLVAGFGHGLLDDHGHDHGPAPTAGGLALAGATATATAVSIGRKPSLPTFDLLNLPRPRSTRPWAYVKVAEGCDRACGFCAIPSFRGPQRSRSIATILDEVEQLGADEIVLVAQDLAAFGRDQGVGERSIIPLVQAVAERVRRTRLLYLYPSDLTDGLIDAIIATGVPYFDLSLQHVSPPLVRRMRRWGNGDKFLARIDDIRRREPTAAFRSNFIVGYPGETEDDHDELLRFVEEAEVDWCGFFAYSPEDGTYAADLPDQVPEELVGERLAELRELQDAITARKRDELIGSEVEVLVDTPGVARSHREAPEIDGVISVPEDLPAGTFATLTVTGALGPDLEASR